MSPDNNNRPPAPKQRSGVAGDDIAGFMPGHDVEIDDEEEDVAPLPGGPDVAFTKIEWDVSARDTDGKSGADVINEFVKRLPNAPGVYRMLNAAGDALYVGKARSLKKRVTNYAQGRFHTDRIGREGTVFTELFMQNCGSERQWISSGSRD